MAAVKIARFGKRQQQRQTGGKSIGERIRQRAAPTRRSPVSRKRLRSLSLAHRSLQIWQRRLCCQTAIQCRPPGKEGLR